MSPAQREAFEELCALIAEYTFKAPYFPDHDKLVEKIDATILKLDSAN